MLVSVSNRVREAHRYTLRSLETSVETVEGHKVRLHVAVPADRFERAVDAAFRKLAQEVKIPGFRPGKAPRKLLEAQFGAGVAREQALRDAIPEYYTEAVGAEQLDTIAAPEIDITAGEEEGDVEFDAVVELRPEVTISGYQDLQVTLEVPEIDDEAVDAQIDQLRERFAELEDSSTPLVDGDFASIDVQGYVHDEVIDGLTSTDYLYEVGSGRVVPELDDELRGERPGAILKFNATLPATAGEHAGDEVSFQVLVKETKRKVLPAGDDEFASEASEFDTIAELGADVRARLETYAKLQAQVALRDKVLEAVAELVGLEPPEALVDQEVQRRLHDLAHRLPEGVSLEQYLQATGQEPEAFLAGARGGAAQAVRADLALRSVVAQEEIEVTDAEVDAEVERLAERLDEKPAKVHKDLDQRGVLDELRSEVARGKALQFLVENAQAVDPAGNALDLELPTESEAESEAETEHGSSDSETTEDDEA